MHGTSRSSISISISIIEYFLLRPSLLNTICNLGLDSLYISERIPFPEEVFNSFTNSSKFKPIFTLPVFVKVSKSSFSISNLIKETCMSSIPETYNP